MLVLFEEPQAENTNMVHTATIILQRIPFFISLSLLMVYFCKYKGIFTQFKINHIIFVLFSTNSLPWEGQGRSLLPPFGRVGVGIRVSHRIGIGIHLVPMLQ